MQSTTETVHLNRMAEKQRYDAMLHATVPTPDELSVGVPTGAPTSSQPPVQPVHRDEITLSDVMGHALVQPFRHPTSLGKATRNSALHSGIGS